MTETVRINTSRPYDVIIGSGILDSCGEYLYDLTVPDLDALPQPKGPSWLRNLWKRGN